ncbi:MAG TPA: glycosyltransferase [Xanthobacteraceae bacterium]|nr:glycosyltransferase [Xanthobacteraceae bacterium]HUO00287.1 glycosyltransferase [Bradyrhizobium sp.]
MESTAVSLVICTRNRAEKLRSCLGYITRQSPSCTWELVVVNNGSTDATADVLKEYAAHVPFPIMILYQAVLGALLQSRWRAAMEGSSGEGLGRVGLQGTPL